MAAANGEIKLLYVEDDDGTRAMLGRLLKQKYPEVTVFTATNGKEGLDIFNEQHPELIVTDISMPVMDGIEMSAAIRRSTSEAIIIAVTAHTDSEHLARSGKLGISHYIVKPVRFKELFAAIDKSVAFLADENHPAARTAGGATPLS